MKICLCVNAFILAVFVTAQTEISPAGPQYYCGSNVANMLKVLCQGIYQDYPVSTAMKNKRISDDTWDYKGLSSRYSESGWNINDPYYGQSSSLMRIPTKRERVQIVQECCYKKPCYLSELKGYCARPGT